MFARRRVRDPRADTAKGKVKDWVDAYKKMFGTDANTRSVIGYNAVMTFAHFAKLAGKDLTGQKMLDALESGNPYLDIFSSPPSKFSKTSSPREHDHAGAADQERPLGRREGRPRLLTLWSFHLNKSPGGKPSGLFLIADRAAPGQTGGTGTLLRRSSRCSTGIAAPVSPS